MTTLKDIISALESGVGLQDFVANTDLDAIEDADISDLCYSIQSKWNSAEDDLEALHSMIYSKWEDEDDE